MSPGIFIHEFFLLISSIVFFSYLFMHYQQRHTSVYIPVCICMHIPQINLTRMLEQQVVIM